MSDFACWSAKQLGKEHCVSQCEACSVGGAGPTIDGIPAFLRIPQAERDAAWKGRKLTQQGTNFAAPRRDEEPATKKLREALVAETVAKKHESLAKLKHWKEEHRK